MRLALCLALASSLAFADPDVASLLKRLADDDPAARDAAQAELVRRGEEALPAVEAALADPKLEDVEARARLDAVAAELRWAKTWSRDPEALVRGAKGVGAEDAVERIESDRLRKVFGETKVFLVTRRTGRRQALLLGKRPGERFKVAADLANIAALAPFLLPTPTLEAASFALETLAGLAADAAHRGEAHNGTALRLMGDVKDAPFSIVIVGIVSWEVFFGADGRVIRVEKDDGC